MWTSLFTIFKKENTHVKLQVHLLPVEGGIQVTEHGECRLLAPDILTSYLQSDCYLCQ